MTGRIWRTGDAPLAPGTRVRALVMAMSKEQFAEGHAGVVSDYTWARKRSNMPTPVSFSAEVNRMRWPDFNPKTEPDLWPWFAVAELEVLDDGGEQ